MKKRVLCALCAAAMLATGIMAGCSGEKKESTGNESSNSSSQAQNDQSSQQESKEEQKVDSGSSGSFSALEATKLGEVNINADDVNPTPSGIIYQTGDKYGVISFDGKKDTGAIYDYADEVRTETVDKGYIVVSDSKADDKNINTCGLVDKNGDQIIPCQYANISMLNDRYAKVITADKETKNKDEALVYYTDRSFSISPEEGDLMYSGKWEIFDLKNKSLLNGATGTKPYSISAKGQFVIFNDDENNEVTMNSSGSKVTDGRMIMDNGSYVLEFNGKSAVYNSDEEKLFDFDAQEFSISRYEEPYYLCLKQDQNYNSTSFLLNDKGETVSAEFKDLSWITPDFVLSDEIVYTLDGTEVFKDRYTRLLFDKVNKDAYLASKDNLTTIFDKKGNVLFSGENNNGEFKIGNNFNFYKGEGSDNKYFNYTNKAFDIAGTDVDSWLIKNGSGNVYDLFDARTGQKLIDSSYGSYTVKTDSANNVTYIYAFNSVNGNISEGSFDIYTISK